MNNEENIQDKVDPSSQSELTSQDESTSQGELVSEYEPEPNTAYLTRFEALCGLIEARSETLLNDWSTDDLISLYSQLRSVPLTDEGISTIVENFQDTSFEEISEVITAVKDLIVENESLRFQHKKFTVNSDAPSKISLSETELEADRRLLDFVTSLTAKKKVHGSTTERLKELFKMFANEAPPTKKFAASSDMFCPAAGFEDEVNYGDIYKFLSETSIIRQPKPLKPLESAILLNVMNEVEDLADNYFDEHVEFFRNVLADIENMGSRDLNPLQWNDEDIGKVMWNIFNLPDDLADLSGYLEKPSDEPSSSADT